MLRAFGQSFVDIVQVEVFIFERFEFLLGGVEEFDIVLIVVFVINDRRLPRRQFRRRVRRRSPASAAVHL